MGKVFVEYQIIGQWRSHYLEFMQPKLQEFPQLELLEGTDQPGLFVEIWHEITKEEYLRLKKQRMETDHQDWNPIGIWTAGGKGKIHIWHFDKPLHIE